MEIKNNTERERTNMEKYKVILVDDEKEAIEAMEHKMDWEGLGLRCQAVQPME